LRSPLLYFVPPFPQAQAPHRSSPTLALPTKSRLLVLSVLLFLSIALILAAPRALPRITSIFNQLRFRPAQVPLAPTSTTAYRPLMTSTMVPDKYKKPPQAPPTFTGTGESIVGDAKKLCDNTRALLDKVVASVKPEDATFANVMAPVVADENDAALSARILGFYQYVSGDAALRDASTEADKLMDDFTIECNMREDVFKLVDGAFSRKDSETSLDPESLRLLDKDRKNYIKNGLGLDAGAQRDRFKEIKKRLSQIQIEFQKNLNEENGGIWFTPKELEGVPDDVVSLLEKGEGENEGKVKLSFKYPDLFPTLKFALDPDTRRKVYIDNENKVIASKGFRAYECLAGLQN
jgi:Zn-dependent oligopeptidase